MEVKCCESIGEEQWILLQGLMENRSLGRSTSQIFIDAEWCQDMCPYRGSDGQQNLPQGSHCLIRKYMVK